MHTDNTTILALTDRAKRTTFQMHQNDCARLSRVKSKQKKQLEGHRGEKVQEGKGSGFI